jgi:maltooligosyltrehalose trehalohydrolase
MSALGTELIDTGLNASYEIGARYLRNNRSEFIVWAPRASKVELRIVHPQDRVFSLLRKEGRYWRAVIENVSPGMLYYYRLDETVDRPDPASHFQPRGVHGPSQVIDHSVFPWDDIEWRGISLEEMIIYELHVGTFTPEGTFDAIVPRLAGLRELGITAIELMPVSQFPGDRNWGYDGTFPFAVQNSYGGPEGLKSLVNACHKIGLAVILDVVYNHLGPEGNYTESFGSYFTGKYRTPWGKAINFDDEQSEGVRNYFIRNALHWFKNYHIDALRLDAVHAIFDESGKHILQEMAEATNEYSARQGRKFHLIAESDLNDTRIIRTIESGGYGIDAQWCDDFHHALRAMLTGERTGYYEDFGTISHLVKAFEEGFVYSGQYSEFRKKPHGCSSKDIPGHSLVVFAQNHDQAGNRMLGERLSLLISFEALKVVAGAVMLAPYIPMLFMGEEYAESAPFLYFVSHGDPDLISAVREGRKAEFSSFKWTGEPPDPQSPETFLRSKLRWEDQTWGKHKTMHRFYKRLIELRKQIPALADLNKENIEVQSAEDSLLVLRRWHGGSQVFCLMNLGEARTEYKVAIKEGGWERVLDSAEKSWDGPGSLLPARIRQSDQVSVRGHSFGLYSFKA